MVTIGRVCEVFDIPQSTVYYLVNNGRLPAHEERKPWRKQRRLYFRLSEVKAALDRMVAESEQSGAAK